MRSRLVQQTECVAAFKQRSVRSFASAPLRPTRPPPSVLVPSVVSRSTRPSSSLVPAAPSPNAEPAPLPEEPEKVVKRATGRARTAKGLDGKAENITFPDGLADKIIWLPEENPSGPAAWLPPEDMLQEAFSNVNVALHPRAQHRATYQSASGPPVEPSVTLYCPIEGGTYVIDSTVQELARRVYAELLILDAVDVLAGEWGDFGPAANALQLPHNPLQLAEFPSAPSRPHEEDDEEEDGPALFSTIVEGSPPGLAGRSPFIAVRRPTTMRSGPSQVKKNFFTELLNLQRATDDEVTNPPASSNRPRLIYIRDFSLLDDTVPHWYAQFIAAMRVRRMGPMSRPTTTVLNPTVVIQGVSPSIITPRPTVNGGNGPHQPIVSMLVARRNRFQRRPSPSSASPSPKSAEWDESPSAQKQREKRLQERLQRWDKGDTSVFRTELPPLSLAEREEGPARGVLSQIFVAMHEGGPPNVGEDDAEKGRVVDYSRLTVLLPRERDSEQEVKSRVARRMQINEVNMRTAIGSIGGTLTKSLDISVGHLGAELETLESRSFESMLHDWGQRVETWAKTKSVADRAIGSLVADKMKEATDGVKITLDQTRVPWSIVVQSWAQERDSRKSRKAFLTAFRSTKPPMSRPKGSLPLKGGETAAAEEEDEAEEDEENDIPALIESLKQSNLDPHEERLLTCIVNPVTMPTTFAQVHLPDATIDSIRTIVSLPLLHPAAFKHGILKQHSMTGALLFGAPGTGKTLSVRALARESGARMMIVKPSDVMDMYVGEGEKLVRAVFSLARRISPCVVFIDEIDSLLGARHTSRTGSDIAHGGVVTEFMQEMDGLRSDRSTNVVVIGATNRPFDLDDAVLRRLPRRLLIDLPGEKERAAILRILLTDEQLESDVDVEELAKRTDSFSGSDLKHLCVAAALDAVKENAQLPWSVPTDHRPSSTISVQLVVSAQNSPTIPPTIECTSEKFQEQDGAPTVVESDVTDKNSSPPRTLRAYHFEKALKEITPSASEAMGTLTDLRKWNDEFGEGGKKRGKRIWGGKFGFMLNSQGGRSGPVEDGRVQNPHS